MTTKRKTVTKTVARAMPKVKTKPKPKPAPKPAPKRAAKPVTPTAPNKPAPVPVVVWPVADAPADLRELNPARDVRWIVHCPAPLATRFGDDVPMFLNGKIQEGNWRNFVPGLGFATHHDHPAGDGFVIVFTES